MWHVSYEHLVNYELFQTVFVLKTVHVRGSHPDIWDSVGLIEESWVAIVSTFCNCLSTIVAIFQVIFKQMNVTVIIYQGWGLSPPQKSPLNYTIIISLFLYFYLTRWENMFSSLIWKLANSAIHLRLTSGIPQWEASLDEMMAMRQLAWKVHGVGRRRHLELGHLRRRVLHSSLHNSALEL